MANTTKLNIEVGMHANKQEFDKFNKDLENLLFKIKQQANAQTDPKIRKELEEQFKTIEKMAMAYEKAFDNKNGQINIQKLNQEMQKANVTVQQFYNSMAKAGQEGSTYYNNWANSILNTNIQLKQSNQLLDRMAVTFKNTIRYGISSSIFNNFTNSIQKAYNYTKNLDTSLNDIRIVSDQSAEQMERLAVSANKAAKALGKTTLDYTKAATIYYQQGLSSDEVEKRTEATLKAANVTGQNAQEVSEQLTAVWNGYRVASNELELYVDKLAAVAAHSASNLEELSTGMSKVAAAASVMGVDIDQLTAQMSTIISVTRQAPESVGTALRTIYGRIADIKAGLDEDTSLGNYSGKMAKLGYNVLDASGNLRDMGDVIEEIGNSWNNLTREQQVNLAQTMAGIRQYNNLLTLFDNWDKYTDALSTAENAAGTLQHQQDIYMESTQAHLEQLQATAEETYSALFDQEQARDFIDLVTGGLSTINKYLNGLNTGALGGVLGQLGTLGANLFSSQIASGISNGLANRRKEINNLNTLELQEQIAGFGVRVGGETQNEFNVKDKYFVNRKNLLEASRGLGVEKYQELVEKSQEVAKLHAKIVDQLEDWNNIMDKLPGLEQQYKGQLEEIAQLEDKRKNSSDGLTEDEQKRLEVLKQEANEAIVLRDKLSGLDVDSINQYQQGEKEIADAIRLGNEQQRINDIIRGTTSLLATWNNLWTGINIVFDDNLSNWEKFQGLVGIAGTQIMLFLTSADSLSRLLPSLVVQFGLLTKEEAADLTIKKLLSGETKLEIGLKLKKILVEKAEKLGIEGLTESESLYNIVLAITEALLANIGGLSAAAVVAIAALTVAIGAGVVALIDANSGLNYYNKQIEKATENLDKTKEKYNELTSTISSYEDARKGIDNLTEGTLEFYDAILNSNEQAEKLIDLLGLIAGLDYAIDKNGAIVINEQSLKNAQFKKQQEVYQSSANLMSQRMNLSGYQKETQIADLQKKINAKGFLITAEQAEKLLKGETDIGTVYRNKMYHSSDSFDRENVAVIQDIMQEELAEYRKFTAQEEAERAIYAGELIRGYLSQGQVELYNKGSKETQELINKATGNSLKKTNSAIEQEFVSLYENIPLLGEYYSGMGQWMADNAYVKGPLGKIGSVLGAYAPMLGGIGIYDKYQEREIKEEYMKSVLGMSEEEVNDKKARDNIPLDEALNALRNGVPEALNSAEKALEQYRNISNSLTRRSDLSSLSKNKIEETYMGAITGQLSNVDIRSMTPEDRNILVEELKNTYNADQELVNKVNEYINETKNAYSETIRTNLNLEMFNETLASEAERLNTTKSALEAYNYALKETNKISKEATEETAKQTAEMFEFNKKYNEGRDTYKDNEKAIERYVKAMKAAKKEMITYADAEAMGKLKDQLSDIGLALNMETIVKNFDTVKKLLNGTEKEAEAAYKKLAAIQRDEAISEFENTAKTAFENIKKDFESGNIGQDVLALSKWFNIDDLNNFENQFAQFANYISGLDPGAPIEKKWSAALLTMINNAHLTQEQAEEIFNKMNISIPKPKMPEPKEGNIKEPAQEYTHRAHGRIPTTEFDENGKPKFAEFDFEWYETSPEKNIPYVTYDTAQDLTFGKKGNPGGGGFKRVPKDTGKTKKGSSSKSSKKDPNKDELDRYQLVNVQLKEISKELTKLDKQKKKLLGGDLVKNLNKQINYLNDQIDVTEAKLKIAEKERAEKAKTLSGYGAKFDEQGNVYNYETIFKQEQARLNKVYDKYNKMSKAQQEKYESTVKSAEERFKKFNDTISRYNTLNSDMIPGLEQDIADTQDKITEDLIEEFNLEIKVRLDLADAKKEWNEFTRKYLKGWKDEDVDKWASGIVEDFSSLINGNEEEGFGGTLIEVIDQLGKFEEEYNKFTSDAKAGDWYRDNAAQFSEDWKNIIDEAQEKFKEAKDAMKEMNEVFIQAMTLAQEKFDEQLDNFEAINKQIEHNIDLINLLYGEDSYDKIEKQQKARRDNTIEELAMLRQEKQYYDSLLKTLNKEDAAWKEAKAGAQAVDEAIIAKLNEGLEEAAETFETGVAAVIKDMTDKLTNGKGFDLINKQWELMNENSQLELDNINRMQGLQDIAKKYNDAINNTSNVKAQKELAEIRDKEIEQLKEIDHLSQEDLERAEKKLEIVKAQIALEDAQQNKTQMRLRRDSQGNYRYQFVANEDQVNQAKDQLAAAYNSLYNFDKQRALQNNQEMISTTQQYFEEIANLRIRYGDDEQKYKEEKRILDEQYNEKMAILEEHRLLNEKNLNESTFADLNNLYAQNANNYELMTDAQKAALNSFEAANQTAFDLIFGLETENTEAFRNMADEEKRAIEEELIPQWNSGVDEMIRKLTDEGGFEKVATKIWNDITEKIKDYFKFIEEAEETSGRTFEELLGSENSIIERNKQWAESNKEVIKTIIDATESAEKEYETLKKLVDIYGPIIEKKGQVIDTNQKLYEQFMTNMANSIRDTLEDQPTSGGTGDFNQPTESEPEPKKEEPKKDTKPSIPFDGTLPKGTQLYNASGGKYNKTQAARTVTVTADAGSRYQVWGSTFNPHTVYIDKNAIKYDTGGYTGEWGNGGRLALLHQKELVLNRKDTANMLNAVEVLRGITDSIGADLLGRMAGMTAGGFNSTVGGNALEQSVHIEATFPGVKSSIEIQDALNNLVNMAAQRAQIR